MSSKNNTDQNTGQSSKMVTINTIQRTALVERLCVSKHYSFDNIIPYDIDNLYPNKVKNIALRSGTVKGAIQTLSSFVRGEGFDGMDIVVNRHNHSLWDILKFMSKQKSMFNGYSLHFNFNAFGEITEIQTLPFEWARWHRDLDKIVVNQDWGKRRRLKEEFTYEAYNPETLEKGIEKAGSLEEYEGQVLYFNDEAHEIYTPTGWDAVIDDAQFEAESKIYSLSSIQNDYSLSGIVIIPKYLEDDKEVQAWIKELKKDTGSANAGGIRVFGANPQEELRAWPWFKPISRNNIDNMFENQKKTAKENIYHWFRQPAILNGMTDNGMFNTDDYYNAFTYYNTQTETERKDMEKQLSWILSNSIFPLDKVEIKPKTFEVNGQTTD